MTADLFDILPRRQIKRRGKPAQQYIESTSPLSQRDSYVWTEDQRFDYERSLNIKYGWPDHDQEACLNILVKSTEAFDQSAGGNFWSRNWPAGHQDPRNCRSQTISSLNQFWRLASVLLVKSFSLIWNVFQAWEQGRRQLCFNPGNMPLVGLLFQTY